MDLLLGIARSLYLNQEFGAIVALILIDLVVGVAAALKLGHFDPYRLPDWLTDEAIPALVGYGACAALSVVIPDLSLFGYTLPPGTLGHFAFVTIAGRELGSIFESLKELNAAKADPPAERPDPLAKVAEALVSTLDTLSKSYGPPTAPPSVAYPAGGFGWPPPVLSSTTEAPFSEEAAPTQTRSAAAAPERV